METFDGEPLLGGPWPVRCRKLLGRLVLTPRRLIHLPETGEETETVTVSKGGRKNSDFR